VPVEKIDAFCHTMSGAYFDRFSARETTPAAANIRRRVSKIPSLVDMEVRLARMDEFADYRQVINIAAPPVEDLGSKQISKEMARVGNEALCELVAKHPDRFGGFIACVPMDDTDAAIAEAEYACTELGARGVQIYTHEHVTPWTRSASSPSMPGWRSSTRSCRCTRAETRVGRTTRASNGNVRHLLGW
jgi:predicted TIM-barrel fold metal-dependent hydrolase